MSSHHPPAPLRFRGRHGGRGGRARGPHAARPYPGADSTPNPTPTLTPPPIPTLCQVCNLEPPKYKCPVPGCGLRHCSLPCAKTHKLSHQSDPDPGSTPAPNQVTTPNSEAGGGGLSQQPPSTTPTPSAPHPSATPTPSAPHSQPHPNPQAQQPPSPALPQIPDPLPPSLAPLLSHQSFLLLFRRYPALLPALRLLLRTTRPPHEPDSMYGHDIAAVDLATLDPGDGGSDPKDGPDPRRPARLPALPLDAISMAAVSTRMSGPAGPAAAKRSKPFGSAAAGPSSASASASTSKSAHPIPPWTPSNADEFAASILGELIASGSPTEHTNSPLTELAHGLTEFVELVSMVYASQTTVTS